jgi:rod shape-determining protein MreD
VKPFYLTLTVLLFLLAQVSLAPRISIGAISPDFVLLIVVFFALYRGSIRGAIFGFVVGFLQDLGNPEMLGLNAMTKSMLGFLMGHAGTKTFPDNVLFLGGLFFVAAFGHDIVYQNLFKWPNVGGAIVTIFTVALPSAFYTSVLGVAADSIMSLFGAKVVTTFGKEGHL